MSKDNRAEKKTDTKVIPPVVAAIESVTKPVPVSNTTTVVATTTAATETTPAVAPTEAVATPTASPSIEPAVVAAVKPVVTNPVIVNTPAVTDGFFSDRFSKDNAASLLAPAAPSEPAFITKLKESGMVIFSEEVEARIYKFSQDGNVVVTEFIEQLRAYIKAMSPGQVQPIETAVLNQVRLFHILKGYVEKVDTNFPIAFAVLLKIIHEHLDGVFNDRYVFRHIEQVSAKLNREDFKLYQELVDLFKLAAPAQGRDKAINNFNFNSCLQKGITLNARQKILSFFKL